MLKKIISQFRKTKEMDSEKKMDIYREIDIYREKSKKLSQLISRAYEEKTAIENTISKLNIMYNAKKYYKGISITDHAIVRYVERVMGIDIGKITKEILDDTTIEKIKENDYTLINNRKGYQLRLKGNKVITLIFND